jgi:protein-L-isoaspartate O-methyltransferase
MPTGELQPAHCLGEPPRAASGRRLARRSSAAVLLAFAALAHGQEGEPEPPFVTTPGIVVERMLALAETGTRDTVIDLGSGDGRIVIAAAARFGARGLGVELDERLVRASRENARRAGVAERVEFLHGDVLRADLSPATVVTIYLLASLMERLQPKLLGELAPGTRIVSHAFQMRGWRPDRQETVRLTQRHPMQGDTSEIFLWIVPAQVRGVWRSVAPSAGREWRFAIAQNFQEIEVEGVAGEEAFAASDAALSGTSLSWRMGKARFRGRVQGDRIVGEIDSPPGKIPLVLVRG